MVAVVHGFWIAQQFESARIACEESLTLFRACGDRNGKFGCLLTLAGIYQFLEGMERMREYRLQALNLARSLGDPAKEATTLDGLGWDQRDPQRSRGYWDQAIALYRQIGDWRNLAFLIGVYGHTLLANGEVEAAHVLLDESGPPHNPR